MSASAKALRFDQDSMWVELADGRTLWAPLGWLPRLLNATPKERARFEISGGGTGLHWDELEEDISVARLLAGRPARATRLP